jgi:hypothetical protein
MMVTTGLKLSIALLLPRGCAPSVPMATTFESERSGRKGRQPRGWRAEADLLIAGMAEIGAATG